MKKVIYIVIPFKTVTLKLNPSSSQSSLSTKNSQEMLSWLIIQFWLPT